MSQNEGTDAALRWRGDPHLEPELVARVLGKHLLIGVTYVKYTGEVIEQVQLHGIVEEITQEKGIVTRLADGSVYSLPPDLRGIREAATGTFRLRSTGEEVVNPDYLYTWTITRPDA